MKCAELLGYFYQCTIDTMFADRSSMQAYTRQWEQFVKPLAKPVADKQSASAEVLCKFVKCLLGKYCVWSVPAAVLTDEAPCVDEDNMSLYENALAAAEEASARDLPDLSFEELGAFSFFLVVNANPERRHVVKASHLTELSAWAHIMELAVTEVREDGFIKLDYGHISESGTILNVHQLAKWAALRELMMWPRQNHIPCGLMRPRSAFLVVLGIAPSDCQADGLEEMCHQVARRLFIY